MHRKLTRKEDGNSVKNFHLWATTDHRTNPTNFSQYHNTLVPQISIFIFPESTKHKIIMAITYSGRDSVWPQQLL